MKVTNSRNENAVTSLGEEEVVHVDCVPRRLLLTCISGVELPHR